MPFVCRVGETLSLEDVAEVTTAVGAGDFDALHEEGVVLVTLNGAGDRVKVGRPPTATAKLVRGLVQGGVATSASVDALGGVMLVVRARAGPLCAFLAEDAELL